MNKYREQRNLNTLRIRLHTENKSHKLFGFFGAWRRPVAHLNGVQGVAGSNPVAPTRVKKEVIKSPFLLGNNLFLGLKQIKYS